MSLFRAYVTLLAALFVALVFAAYLLNLPTLWIIAGSLLTVAAGFVLLTSNLADGLTRHRSRRTAGAADDAPRVVPDVSSSPQEGR